MTDSKAHSESADASRQGTKTSNQVTASTESGPSDISLSADIVQDLRTPLAVIRLYVEALQDGMVEDQNDIFQRLERKIRECEQLLLRQTHK